MMGRGDRYQESKFTVAPSAPVQSWPFPVKPVRPYCETCDRPADFCECKPEEDPPFKTSRLGVYNPRGF